MQCGRGSVEIAARSIEPRDDGVGAHVSALHFHHVYIRQQRCGFAGSRDGRTFQRLAENLVFNEAPKLVRQLQRSPAVQRGIKIGIDAIIGAVAEPPAEITTGRPVTRNSAPTAHRARKLVYSPNLDGRADPGEVVWTWVTYEEDPTRGKDRPVLVVGRDHATLLGLMLSSQERHATDRDWVEIGSGSWDYDGRPSWVRLDRVLDVPEESIRREGAILERHVFDAVAARLRRDYSWS